jgi:cell division protein FtsN
VPHPAAVSPAKPATPKTTARVATTPKPAAAVPNANTDAARTSIAAKAKRVQVADAQDQVAAAEAPRPAPGTFAVQLAAPGTEQEAREAQVHLMKKFSAELAGFHPSIHKAEVGGKPVYRVRVSGLSSKDEATALCQKVQSGGGSCFVAKN